jgi:DNA-directed RNA polymerase subunit RPC12/RpoP
MDKQINKCPKCKNLIKVWEELPDDYLGFVCNHCGYQFAINLKG